MSFPAALRTIKSHDCVVEVGEDEEEAEEADAVVYLCIAWLSVHPVAVSKACEREPSRDHQLHERWRDDLKAGCPVLDV